MSDHAGLPVRRLVVEFALIVGGVLVARSAESAWQERAERRQGREIVHRISADLEADAAILEFDRSWFDQIVPVIEEVRRVVDG